MHILTYVQHTHLYTEVLNLVTYVQLTDKVTATGYTMIRSYPC